MDNDEDSPTASSLSLSPTQFDEPFSSSTSSVSLSQSDQETYLDGEDDEEDISSSEQHSPTIINSTTPSVSSVPSSSEPSLPLIRLKLVNIVKTPDQKLLHEWLGKCIMALKLKDAYEFFMEPVDTSIVTDYLSVIKNPMDLSTMAAKNNRHEYTSFSQLQEDFELICSNAMTYNAPTTIYYKSAQRFLNIGRKIIKRESIRFNDRLVKLEQKKRVTSKQPGATLRKKYQKVHHANLGHSSLYEQAILELGSSKGISSLPSSTKKVLEAKIALFKKCQDGSWLFSSRNRIPISPNCYNKDGSLNCGAEKYVKELILGPFHNRSVNIDGAPLLGSSSEILQSIKSRFASTSTVLGRPTSDFWGFDGNSNFYDSLGYPVDDFNSPSLALAYGDPKGREFVDKLVKMNPSSGEGELPKILSQTADEITLGGYSFLKFVEAFKKKHEPNLRQKVNTQSRAPNDDLLLEISSLLIKMNSIKAQLIGIRQGDPTVLSELGAISVLIRDKLVSIASKCNPKDLLGPKMESTRMLMKDLAAEPIPVQYPGTLHKS